MTTRSETDKLAAFFSELLNDKIQEAILEVARQAGATMDVKYTQYEAKLCSMHRKQQAVRHEKDEQERRTIRESSFNQWEE